MKTEIEYCKHCGKESGYWDTESEEWIEITKHRICQNTSKFEKMSILDKNAVEQRFIIAKTLSEVEENYLKEFKLYCDRFEKAKMEGVGFLMFGNAGTGKTFYSNCIANELMNKGYTVLSFAISGYLNEIKKGFDKDNPINNVEDKLLSAVETVDLVIIDDVGSENLTDWARERMFNLFDKIYRQNKVLGMTSNLSGEELKRHFMVNGSDKIFDRILQMCKRYKFSWGSRRKIIGNEKFAKVFGEAI